MKDWKEHPPTRQELADKLMCPGDAVIRYDMTVLTLIAVKRTAMGNQRFFLTVEHIDGSQSEIFITTAD